MRPPLLSNIPHFLSQRLYTTLTHRFLPSTNQWHPVPSRSLDLSFHGPSGIQPVLEAIETVEHVTEGRETGSAEGGRRKKKERTLEGVILPERPPPPGPEECCMSGCAHCVYDIYADSLTEYKLALADVRFKLTSRSIPQLLWPTDIRPPARTSGKGSKTGQTERELAEQEVDEEIQGLDSTYKVFLEMERKLRKRKRERKAEAKATVV